MMTCPKCQQGAGPDSMVTCAWCGWTFNVPADIPARSSGALWAPDEDALLYQSVLELTAKFPGRSLAAVLTRIRLKAWWE